MENRRDTRSTHVRPIGFDRGTRGYLDSIIGRNKRDYKKAGTVTEIFVARWRGKGRARRKNIHSILLIPDLHAARRRTESRKDSEANVGKLLANWKYDTPGPLPRSVLSPATNSTYYSTFQVAV